MSVPASARGIRGADDFRAAFHVSRETTGRLQTYERLLRQWQAAVNLVAPGTLDAVWHRHFADSAQLVRLAPPGLHHWIDLGSGAGFPGLVVAILLADTGLAADVPSPLVGEGQGGGDRRTSEAGAPPNPSLSGGGGPPLAEPKSRVSLVESDTRKAAFLREVARQTAIPAGVAVDVLSIRAESVRFEVNVSLPRVICARALAPLDRLFELAAPLSPPGTVQLWCKGKGVGAELQAAEKRWKFDVELVPSVTDSDGRIAVITNLERKAKD